MNKIPSVNTTTIVTTTTLPSESPLVGKWELSGSKNFEEYMEALGKFIE